MTRNSRLAFDQQHIFRRDAPLRPSCNSRFVHAKHPREIDQFEPFLGEAVFQEAVAHKVERCATHNDCQAGTVVQRANDRRGKIVHFFEMTTPPRIHASKQPRRPHFIKEWAAKRNLTQAQLGKELGADKGVVSRWYSGSSPTEDWQKRLAAFFGCEPDALFRHPDDDWLKRFFDGRNAEEIERIKQMLDLAFPVAKKRA